MLSARFALSDGGKMSPTELTEAVLLVSSLRDIAQLDPLGNV